MKYPVTEHFHSPQGEGVHNGRNAYFVRLYGCNQKCGFCDSAATWHAKWKPINVPQLTPVEICKIIYKALGPAREEGQGAFVVVTGGEPCLYNLDPLVDEIARLGRRVHIETAGHCRLPRGAGVWITMSPKFFAIPPLPENWEHVDEVKLICTSPEQLVTDADRILNNLYNCRKDVARRDADYGRH